jgi:hypothetical protein
MPVPLLLAWALLASVTGCALAIALIVDRIR